jgi:sulfonate transport system permease protein
VALAPSDVDRLRRAAGALWLPALVIALWQLLCALGVFPAVAMPSPLQVARAFGELIQTGALFRHVGVSLLRVLAGGGAAAVAGIGLGIAIGLSARLERTTDLLLEVLRPIPPIAWIPMAILWFGIGELSKVYIIFLGAFFPILLNVVSGIRQTENRFVEVARVLEVSRGRFIRHVVVPGALPSIMSALRLGLGIAWICVVAAELIAASSGVGYLIMDARQLSQPDVVLAGMITIGVVGRAMDLLLRRLERRVVSWKVIYAGE